MLINDSYDRTLWLMMRYDKEDRNLIVDFIKNFPDELYMEIRNNLLIIDECKKNNNSVDKKLFNGNYDKDDKLFYYSFNSYDNSLSLGCSILIGECYDEDFEIELYSSDDLENVTKNLNVFVATIKPYKNSFSDGHAKRLWVGGGILSNTPYRSYMLESSYREILSFGVLNINNIPNELEIDKIDLLVKKRKK